MTARRPHVPRAGPPAPPAGDQPARGASPVPPSDRRPAGPAGARVVGPGHGSAPTRSGQAHVVKADARSAGGSRTPGPSATKDPRSVTTSPRRPGPGGGPGKGRPASASEARAAERSQLAPSIRRGRLGARRVETAIQPAEDATPIPARSFSGRLLALAVVLVAVIVMLAPSVSRYVQQESELDALRAEIAVQQQDQAAYRSELARWEDPAFVRQQARERIFLVMPGETRYLVKGAEGIEESTGEGSAAGPAELPWVDSLWNSITRAATD
ncbi:FtsB family cell division protein [Arthrobacter sp. RIT-PI-e]|uniref:FtsB family cell division protein n=1 Tax=Arthrobacter sp. RIT-PI-e TaxID=1681197 RepID=UPI0009E43801|nr:septum formation initiator family protein [Arthrobacter sp. RIT-PI-e]